MTSPGGGGRKIGDAFVNVKADTSGMAPQLKKDAEKAGNDAGDGFASHFLKALATVAVAVGGLVIGKALVEIKKSVAAASDLNETVSKTQVIFGASSASIEAWASKAAASMGQSEQTALDGADAFAIYGKAAGKTGPALVQFSTSLTQLASDVGSFTNVDPAQVIEDFGSALRGEFDPVEKYGILLNDATIKQEALKLGIIKSTKDALTPQQRVLAVQSALFKQTTLAQGDFARTSAGLANQQRIVQAQMANLRTEIGTAFIPAFVSIQTTLSQRVLPALQQLWAVHGPQVTKFVEDAAAKFDKFVASIDFAKVSQQLTAFFDTLKGGIPTTDQITGKASAMGESIRRFWDELKKGTEGGGKTAETLNSLKDSLSVFGVVISFTADHVDLLAKALPYLAAGLLLAKAARIAANVAEAVAPVTALVNAAAVRRLAKAQEELAAATAASTAATAASSAAQVTNTAATSTGIVAKLRDVAASVAQRVAQIAQAVATGVVTAAQWLLNIALTANPIGLIILAVVALVAVFVLLWKNSDGFRNFFISMWDSIWSVLKAIGAWFAGPFADFFVNAWNMIVAGAKAVYNFFVVTIPNGIRSLYTSVSNTMQNVRSALIDRIAEAVIYISQVPGRIIGFFSNLGSKFVEVGKSLVQGIISGLENAMGWLINKAADMGRKALDAVKSAIGFGSPARKFFPVGESMAQGIGVGVDRAAPDLRAKLDALVALPSGASGLMESKGVTKNTTLNVYGAQGQSTAEIVAEVKRELAWEGGI
jgi:hypothetical protein